MIVARVLVFAPNVLYIITAVLHKSQLPLAVSASNARTGMSVEVTPNGFQSGATAGTKKALALARASMLWQTLLLSVASAANECECTKTESGHASWLRNCR